MQDPYISVIVPLYNKEDSIESTINSVLNQSYNNCELIIVNDGSSDRSVEIVRGINDNRIVLIEQNNGGPSKARNTGVTNSHGSWILFLDADDELMPGALEHFAKLVQTHQSISMFCCEFSVKKGTLSYDRYRYNNTIVNNAYKSWFYDECCPRTGATIYSRELVMQCPFMNGIRRFEDLECLFRMFRFSKMYLSHFNALTLNVDYASASTPRQDIKEDFLGHLDFSNKSFWEFMCLYQLYLGERDNYTHEIDSLYPHLRYRYDLLLLYKLLHFYNIIKKNVFQRKH